ncbi:hypothetical protein KKB55_09155 [Myxococcota bacterium]|nr:hypothetical protein [Myxococcota bacterium]MBU1897902.1 hypothetical protein [Myxococcota bacterium]
MSSKSFLKSLMNLYLFTWAECLSFAQRMRTMISSQQVQDERLNEMITRLEVNALAYPAIKHHQQMAQAPTVKIMPQMQRLSKLMTFLRDALTGLTQVAAQDDPRHQAAHAQLQALFSVEQRGRRAAHQLIAHAQRILLAMAKHQDAWALMGLDHLQPTLAEAHAQLYTLYMQTHSSLNSDAQRSAPKAELQFEDLSPLSAQAALQDELLLVVAYMITTYYQRPETSAVFNGFVEVVEGIQALAAARCRRPASPSASPSEAVA